MDTVVIILRRKWRQLSFLHVYHHISVFLVCCTDAVEWFEAVSQVNWMNLRAGYDGDIYFMISLNSFIHVIMYAYYQCTTLDIAVRYVRSRPISNTAHSAYHVNRLLSKIVEAMSGMSKAALTASQVPKPIKQLVTQLQMLQFLSMNGQALYILYFDCAYPHFMIWLYLVCACQGASP